MRTVAVPSFAAEALRHRLVAVSGEPDDALLFASLNGTRSSEAISFVDDLRSATGADWRVLTLTVHPDRASGELRVYYGAEADAWFVDLGCEEEVAELARPRRLDVRLFWRHLGKTGTHHPNCLPNSHLAAELNEV